MMGRVDEFPFVCAPNHDLGLGSGPSGIYTELLIAHKPF